MATIRVEKNKISDYRFVFNYFVRNDRVPSIVISAQKSMVDFETWSFGVSYKSGLFDVGDEDIKYLQAFSMALAAASELLAELKQSPNKVFSQPEDTHIS